MRATDRSERRGEPSVQPADDEIIRKRKTRCAYQKVQVFCLRSCSQRERKVKEHATCSSEEQKERLDVCWLLFRRRRTALQDGGISFSSSSSADDFPEHPLATHITSLDFSFRFPLDSVDAICFSDGSDDIGRLKVSSSRPLMIHR